MSGATDRRPDLPDIMEAGLGLTDALQWWNDMMNSGEPPDVSWRMLSELKEQIANDRRWFTAETRH